MINNRIKILYRAIAFLLLVTVVFPVVPYNLNGQETDKDTTDLTPGEKIALRKLANPTVNKMSVRTFAEIKSNADLNKSIDISTQSPTGGGVTYFVLNIEFKDAKTRQQVFTNNKVSLIENAHVLTVIDRFADVFVSDEAVWEALRKHPDIVKVEYATEIKVPPPPPIEQAKLVPLAIPEGIVRGGYKDSEGKEFKGKGVTIAILDTGIDFRHPDFITPDAGGQPTSRIKYLWDTGTEYQAGRGNPGPLKFPNGTPIGTLYTDQQLNDELRSAEFKIPATDLDGHGTACASVAAGNGDGDKRNGGLKRRVVEGVAPEADIIGIKLGKNNLENIYLLNAAIEWLESVVSKEKPLVVSGSFGGQYAGHDGQTVEERQLNMRFPLTASGRSVVFAAGNEGNDYIHAKASFSTAPKTVSWIAAGRVQVRAYFDSDDENIQIRPTKATPLENNLVVEINPLTKQMEATFTVNPGKGGVVFENSAGQPTEAHLYFMEEEGRFTPENAVFSHLVGSPGSMENAITVGSFDWNDNFQTATGIINLPSKCRDSKNLLMPFEIGWLSCYSSPGPNRKKASNEQEAVKPDIVAPGGWYVSAAAKNQGQRVSLRARFDSTGLYRAMDGTSAATPYTAGIIALMLQKNSKLKLSEIKDLLKTHTKKDGLNPFPGIPNKYWGYGKLDMSAIDKIFAAVKPEKKPKPR